MPRSNLFPRPFRVPESMSKARFDTLALHAGAAPDPATGARATHGALALDRFWRNLRTQTLHDPVDYKLHELGDWALNGTLPEPSFYS